MAHVGKLKSHLLCGDSQSPGGPFPAGSSCPGHRRRLEKGSKLTQSNPPAPAQPWELHPKIVPRSLGFGGFPCLSHSL